MDYFAYVFHTFLGLDSVIYLAVNRDSHQPPGFHPKYLKLCSRSQTKLLRVWNDMGYVINDTNVSVWGGVTLEHWVDSDWLSMSLLFIQKK